MEPCFEPFLLDTWRDIPALEQRVATPDDVNRCDAIFSTDGRSTVFDTPGLPALAVLTGTDGRKQKIVIIQIETPLNGQPVLVGYVLPQGGNGVATLPEVEVLEYAR